eukprot:TRINITY_DN9813_c0_g1_i1.p1 TRINITY_DN9813_c0_g1~~TRINITY_DN9813_c0_g1_i1.p1  ORF type:complete len:317 (+),score=73.28 TRINITY_DN9813_c0_g1_i1:31-951(+)
MEEQQQWTELWGSMPKSVWLELSSQALQLATTSESSSASNTDRLQFSHDKAGDEADPFRELHSQLASKWADKAVQRFSCKARQFLNLSLEEQQCRVDWLAEQANEAANSESWDQLCIILRDAAAALANPRVRLHGRGTSAELTSNDDVQQFLQKDLQNKLRRILCTGLDLLDLSDEGTVGLLHPSLLFIQSLIARFEGAHGQSVSHAMSGRQWFHLKALAGTRPTAALEDSLHSLSCNAGPEFTTFVSQGARKAERRIAERKRICEHGVRQTRCVKCGGGSICQHQKQRDYCKICRTVQVRRVRRS